VRCAAANLTELARDVGIAGSTARDWLSVLEASSQVALLEPYFNNPTRRLIKTPKLYFRDSGLLCFLLGVESPAALASSPLTGAVWETFVLGQILRARAVTGSAGQVFFWRDTHGVEVRPLLRRLVQPRSGLKRRPVTDGLLRHAGVRPRIAAAAAATHWL
jgi:predicted AAA+ superfamily ATPase